MATWPSLGFEFTVVKWTVIVKRLLVDNQLAAWTVYSPAHLNKTLSSNTGLWVPSGCFVFLPLEQHPHKCKQGKNCNIYPVLDLADTVGKLDGHTSTSLSLWMHALWRSFLKRKQYLNVYLLHVYECETLLYTYSLPT